MTKRLDDEPCPRLEALSALTDDALPLAARASLETHVAGCAVCAPVLAELAQLRNRFAALPRDAATRDFDVTAAVDRRIGALVSSPPPVAPRRPAARPRPWWQLALLAPGGVASVALGLWLGGAAPLPATMATSSPAGAGIATQMAAFSSLPPGSLCPAGLACGGAPR
jgi:anti-sigma factor RsiW